MELPKVEVIKNKNFWSIIFQNFHNCQNIGYLLNITFMFAAELQWHLSDMKVIQGA